MTAHTPGPWNVRQCDGGYRKFDQQDWAVVAGNLITPCLVWGGARFSEGKANAQLISAAPDMLETLQGIARYADDMVIDIAASINAGDTSTIAREELARWSAVGAAIAKATGEKK